MDVPKQHSPRILCEVCLNSIDVLYEYCIKDENLKNALHLQNDHLMLCLYCKRRAYNVECFVKNVFKAQNMLKLLNLDQKVPVEDLKTCQSLSISPIAYIDIVLVEDDVSSQYIEEHTCNVERRDVKMEMVEVELENEPTYFSDEGHEECDLNETQCEDGESKECIIKKDFSNKKDDTNISNRKIKKEIEQEDCDLNESQCDEADDESNQASIADISSESMKNKRSQEKNSERGREIDPKYIETVYLTHEECMAERTKMADGHVYKNSFLKCTDCIKRFAHKDTYDLHMLLHKEDAGDHVCNICRIRRKTKRRLLYHQALHFKRYKCAVCGWIRSHRTSVSEHVKCEHLRSSKFNCVECDKSFITKRKLMQHYYNNHKKTLDKVVCRFCNKTYLDKYILRMHLASKHPVESAAPPAREDLTCQDCGQGFICLSRLKKHIKSKHTATKEHYCVECNRSFTTAIGLRNHFDKTSFHVSLSDARFECEHCKKKFVLKRSMERHIIKDHSAEKPFVCDQCDKKYWLLDSLRSHKLVTHEGYKPPKRYPCTLCDQSFRNNALLKVHMNKHTGERPFECEQCSSTFAQPGALWTHKKLIHQHFKRNRKGKRSLNVN